MALARLDVAWALELHDLIISEWGGTSGILSMAGLESALARPFHGYHNSLSSQAAALMHALIKNHPFVDGNKRTASLAALVALHESGIEILGSRQYKKIDEWAEGIAKGTRTETQLRGYFQRRIVRRPPAYPGGGHIK